MAYSQSGKTGQTVSQQLYNSTSRCAKVPWPSRIRVVQGYGTSPPRAQLCRGGLRAECPGFKCPVDKVPRCCCRRFLYNQPDFFNVKSHLETVCKERGFRVLFLPKFHCELNFTEMCWGFAKRIYRQCPLSSREDDLKCNVIAALDSIPLASMRR